MRLVARLLTAAALVAAPLGAQSRPRLPWERILPLPWQPVPRSAAEASPAPPVPSGGPLSLRVSQDGTVQVVDGRGRVRLEGGLPGRPFRAWRDGGFLLDPPTGAWAFPADTPLAQGLGALRWCAEDFRPFLQGLAWILEDGEGVLSVIHPATGRILYLPMPPGRDLSLRFLPDRLEVVAGHPEPGGASRWTLPWIGLLPRLVELGPHPDAGPKGTALIPFPQQ